MIISSSALASNIDGTATKLGVPLPKSYTAAVAAARALPPEAARMGDVAELHAVALAALQAGRDPGTDADVLRLVAHRVLAEAGFRVAAESLTGDLIVQALGEHQDAIVSGWSAALKPDCAALESAAGQLDQPDLNKADPILLKRQGLLAVWGDAVSAVERIDAGLSGLRSIFAALHIPNDPSVNTVMLSPDANIDTVRAVTASAGRGAIKAWDIARGAGGPLRLATVSEFRAAVARLAAEDQQRERDTDTDTSEHRERQPI